MVFPSRSVPKTLDETRNEKPPHMRIKLQKIKQKRNVFIIRANSHILAIG